MPDAPAVTAALRLVHDNYARLLSDLDAESIRGPSYCDGWSIAQVASHIGSGAELGQDWLRAAIEHGEPMAREEMPAVWDKWDAWSPDEQVSQSVASDAALVAAYEGASPEDLDQAHISTSPSWAIPVPACPRSPPG
jgi:hypothetical protein